METITLAPEYEKLIFEVNNLKDKLAEKIAERDMLAFHIIPDIENRYFDKIGILENEAFLTNLKLIKLNAKIDIYKKSIEEKEEIDEEEIDDELDEEFHEIEEECSFYQKANGVDTAVDKLAVEIAKAITPSYKNLVRQLSPLINFDNTRNDNRLYDLLEMAYRELNTDMLENLQSICNQTKKTKNISIGDVKSLEKAKEKYLEIISENEEIILNIKCSEAFEKQRILENENLTRRVKEEVNQEIAELNEEIKKAEKELKDLIKKL